MIKTYGTITLSSDKKTWHITAAPHVMIRLKRTIEKIAPGRLGTVTLSNTKENCRDLVWFAQRYAFDIPDVLTLQLRARKHKEEIMRLEELLGEHRAPEEFQLAYPARPYQAVAAELLMSVRGYILGDDVGLGKSLVSIAAMTKPACLPAAVVTLTSLPRQWQAYISEFAPQLSTHIIEKTAPYALPLKNGNPPDVLILTYSKLAGWAHALSKYIKFITFDECQELRRRESQKYKAAKQLADMCDYKIGLSATPIYNYGGEIWNVCEVVAPNKLGSAAEFLQHWCSYSYQKPRISDPTAFGTYLRDNFILLRRTRQDVGREIPEIIHVPHEIDSDARELHKIAGSAGALAKILLNKTASCAAERFNAGGQLDSIVRQATGIAKAPFVADFVRILLESTDKVVVFGWHRAVYDIWFEKLKDLGVAYYTGSESGKQKHASVQEFIHGKAKILFMSLRAGAGLDGLEKVCSIGVFGELDWSPGVHIQCMGRLHRDDIQCSPVAYYLVSNDGSDPIMQDVLGIKKEQAKGILDPTRNLIEKLETSGDHIRKLAERYVLA